MKLVQAVMPMVTLLEEGVSQAEGKLFFRSYISLLNVINLETIGFELVLVVTALTEITIGFSENLQQLTL